MRSGSSFRCFFYDPDLLQCGDGAGVIQAYFAFESLNFDRTIRAAGFDVRSVAGLACAGDRDIAVHGGVSARIFLVHEDQAGVRRCTLIL